MIDATITYSGRIVWAAALALAILAGPVQAQGVADAGKLIEATPPKPFPELTLTDLDKEEPANLSAYKGKPLIVNLWATWCGPCLEEMPSLMKLNAALKGQVAVVAIAEDRGGKFQVDPFLKEHNIQGLTIFLDKTSSTVKALKNPPLPTTLLIDAQGNEVGRVVGARDWASAESQAEIAKLLGLKTPG
ncbi:MAG TPA: TlpA disulfide reductase family protein [Alphaproteobacteria bacterium]|jgi:thiol-disulfide isomerase/thioredoxin|nr:TlpA disulfide reductase family protein [Alphaproteobacteria bacterium]